MLVIREGSGLMAVGDLLRTPNGLYVVDMVRGSKGLVVAVPATLIDRAYAWWKGKATHLWSGK